MIGKKMFGQQLVNIILYHTIFTCNDRMLS